LDIGQGAVLFTGKYRDRDCVPVTGQLGEVVQLERSRDPQQHR
jgi:hypothetical protein